MHFECSTFMPVCTYVCKKNHKCILPSVSIPSGIPEETGLPSRDFAIASSPGVRVGGAGPPPVFLIDRLIESIFSFAIKQISKEMTDMSN